MIGKARKYCAPRRVAYPLQLLDVVVDQYAGGTYAKRDFGPINQESPAIVIMNSGHLGDALILSYAFPLIRQRYPNAKIDIVAGSWCDPIWKDNPYIRRVIHLNHIGTSRRSLSRWEKWTDFYQTSRKAIETLRDTTYDYSVDVRFSDSPMHFLLPSIRVKRSSGYGTRGLGGLLDYEFFMPEGEVHNFDLILQLLKPLDVEGDVRTVVPYFFHAHQSLEQLWHKIGASVPAQKPILICPESGNPVRMLTIDYWSQLISQLLMVSQQPILFSGQTSFTTDLYEQVRAANPTVADRLVSAVGKLTLQDIASLSEQAVAAFTLDSLPMHLCCIGCPTFSFQKNGLGIQFFPIASQPTMVLHDHKPSQLLTLDRPGFQSEYVSVFDEVALKRALTWFHEVNERNRTVVA